MHRLRVFVLFSLLVLSKSAILKENVNNLVNYKYQGIEDTDYETVKLEPNIESNEPKNNLDLYMEKIDDTDIETVTFESSIANYNLQSSNQGIENTVESAKFASQSLDRLIEEKNVGTVKFEPEIENDEPQSSDQKVEDAGIETIKLSIENYELQSPNQGIEENNTETVRFEPNIEKYETKSSAQGIEDIDVETVKLNIKNYEPQSSNQEIEETDVETVKLNIENYELPSTNEENEKIEDTDIETITFEPKFQNYEPQNQGIEEENVETVTFETDIETYVPQISSQGVADTDVETVKFGSNIENYEVQSSKQGIEDTDVETVTFGSNKGNYEPQNSDQAYDTHVESLDIEDADSNTFYEPPTSEVTVFGYHMKIGVPLALDLMDSESKPTRVAAGKLVYRSSDIPHQVGIVALLTTGWHSVCGGSLISQTRVLTAAHCWWDGQNQAKSFTVVLGSTMIFSGGTRIETTAVTMHAGWTAKHIMNDIAIVNITSVTYTNSIQPIPLPDSTYVTVDFAGLTGVVSGFGKTSDNQVSTTTHLHHVSVNIIMNSVCQASFQTVSLDSSHLCTSGSGSVGSCDGDSGGPLTTVYNNTRILIGVVSFGLSEGCQYGNPSVFTRVTSFLDWIESRM